MNAAEEAIGHCLQHDLTFVAFRKGDSLHLWVQHASGLEKKSLLHAASGADHFVVAPFASKGDEVFLLAPDVRFLLGQEPFDPAKVQHCTAGTHRSGTSKAEASREAHENAIQTALALMRTGQLRKVVLSRSIPMPFSATALPELFSAALRTYPDAFVCLLNCPTLGTWLGASPERLIQHHHGKVTVDAIAGTLPVGSAPHSAQAWGAKERDEQELVCEALHRSFAAHGAVDVQRTATEVITAGPVAHLRTTFTARVATGSIWDLVKTLHPTPAVCGTPRHSALQFILRHEHHDRKLYAGYWGPWLANGEVELAVNIRCMEVFQERVDIHVGGGITEGSIPNAEWQELQYKANTWTTLMEAISSQIS